MKYILYFTISFTFLMYSCENKEDQTEDKPQNDTTSYLTENNTETVTDTIHLIILGDNIRIRTEPYTGKVVLKLNTGDVCKIIEKGEKVQVRNMLDQKSFIHKDIKYSFLFNPGIYCSGGPHNHIERILPNPVPVKNSFDKKPKGDFCEGYPGIKDGFYYQKISANNLPVYVQGFDEEAGVITKKIDVPKKYSNNEIKKVIVITKEYHNTYFYFINIGSTWYLFCQDFCDCSV